MALAASAPCLFLGCPARQGVTERDAALHLRRVADELQSRVAGNHRAQVGERAGGVQPAPGAIRFDGVEEVDHWGESKGKTDRRG